MSTPPEIRTHQEWLGFLQPVGLVVSAHALARAGLQPDRNIVAAQQCLLRLVRSEKLPTPGGEPAERALVPDFVRLATELLEWDARDLLGSPSAEPLPEALEIALPGYGDRLRPTYAVVDCVAGGAPLLLVQELAPGKDLDAAPPEETRGWAAAPEARFERLLRETKVSIGLLTNGTEIRLVVAPPGESSGHVTFPVAAMTTVAGRPILSALLLLLGKARLFTAPERERLPHLLDESRRYQNDVSTRLAEQVLDALWELLRGFQAANEASRGALLREALASEPEHVYGGLLSTLLRLVFVLYAEDRGLLPGDPVYVGHYSVSGLFERLREDAGRYPDTMDQRYGAWAQLLSLFRLVHDGAAHGALRLPARHGRLFDPEAYPFLEGRPYGARRTSGERLDPPRVADGVVHRVLEKLLLLDGDRLSYRALDVEQIGSVYEAMMGFALEVAKSPSVGVGRTTVVVDLEALLARKPAERARWLQETAGLKLPSKAEAELREAAGAEDALAALGRRVSPRTPRLLPPGSLFLQPSEERRRSGSHYTPRSLTEPIVRTTLRPVLEALGARPRPEAILGLRICDPAMGSGAFLVEACRVLGDALVDAWRAHGKLPAIPPDEDQALFARRLVAQRCLYGVDRNAFAVDLSKLSLWLATLARDHPFTFIDHALRCGDSLVGLSREEIASAHWDVSAGKQVPTLRAALVRHVKLAEEKRAEIAALADSDDSDRKALLLAEADSAVEDLRLAGDCVVSAFFSEERDRSRETARQSVEDRVRLWLGGSEQERASLEAGARTLRAGPKGLPPFHWEIEFPEVFSREKPGFDAVVGNPPFAGKNTIIAGSRESYLPWLQAVHAESHGNSDLVAHFFRRGFDLLRVGGAFGLIATNTIAQGDTRATGLRWIRQHGGQIFEARKRVKWPGAAAVVVSVVHVAKTRERLPARLDGRPVEQITAFLFHAGGDEAPETLAANAGQSFQGSIVLGMGFTFDDSNPDATPIAEMERLLAKDPRNRERIFPYIGGEEVNDSPVHAHRRYVINFGEMGEAEARKWPALWRILEEKVKPERIQKDAKKYPRMVHEWWKFWNARVELNAAIRGMERVLVIARVTQYPGFAFLPAGMVYSEQLVVISNSTYAAFAALQSRPHELWARFFGSSMKDDLRYTPSDCFETFPFPAGWESSPTLEAAGRAYYEYRAALMLRNDEGLTKTYNRFHDPDDTSPEIAELRALHASMDRAVLDAYGWAELRPEPKFLLDYEDEETNEDDAPRARMRKKPWRYRWPDEMRDEVLARLLALNRERAEAERLAGTAAAGSAHAKRASGGPKPPGPSRKKRDASTNRDLFDLE